MRRHLGVAAVDLWLVEAGPDHAGLQVIRNDKRRHRPKRGKGTGMSADPIRQRLAPARFGVGHVRGAHDGNEDLRWTGSAGHRVDHRHPGARVVDEHPLACDMALAHHRRKAPNPAAVMLAKGRVAIAVGVLAPILIPKQRQRDARPLQFAMNHRPVCGGELPVLRGRRRRKHPPLQCLLVQALGQRPGQASHRGTAQILDHRRLPDTGRKCDPPGRHVLRMQAQHVLDLPHRQSPHRAPSSAVATASG